MPARLRHTEIMACTEIVGPGANVRVEFSTTHGALSPISSSYILNAKAKLRSGPHRARSDAEL